VDRWWQELRSIGDDDQLFFEEIANSERDFGQTANPTQRKRFAPDMKVIDEKFRRIPQTGRELFAGYQPGENLNRRRDLSLQHACVPVAKTWGALIRTLNVLK
jgi:hypothetical protein